jgi:hypothetical protein
MFSAQNFLKLEIMPVSGFIKSTFLLQDYRLTENTLFAELALFFCYGLYSYADCTCKKISKLLKVVQTPRLVHTFSSNCGLFTVNVIALIEV